VVTTRGTDYFREPIPLWLLEHLNDQFPDKVPQRRDFDLESLRMVQGQRIVISYIESLLNRELEE